MLRGRLFSKQEGDDKAPIVVINDAMARQIWPGEDPIGKRVGDESQAAVIGVVADVKNYGLLQQSVPEMYAPYTLKNFWPDMRWNLRLIGAFDARQRQYRCRCVRREVQSVDPGQPIYAVQTMNLVIENTVRDKSLKHNVAECLRGRFATAGGDWGLRRDQLYGGPTHARNWNSHDAGGATPDRF